MSQQMQKPKQVGFSFLSDVLKVFQPTEHKESCHKSSQFDLDFELKNLQNRLNALNNLCNRIEKRVPNLSNILQVSECIVETVVEIRSFKGTKPDPNKRGKIIDYLRLLLRVLGLIKNIAARVNQFAPNPIVTKVLIVVGIAHAILTIIISCYDIMNDEGDVLDAILDIVTSIAELVPLTGASDAREIKRTMQTGCRAVSSLRRAVQPTKNNPSVIDMIHKLGDVERCFLDCEAFANQFLPK